MGTNPNFYFMKSIFKVLAVLPAFFMFSCSSDSDSNPSGSCESDIQFFQTGKTYNYALTQFGFDAGTMQMAFGACNGDGVFSVLRTFEDAAGNETGSQTDKMKIDGNFLAIDVANSENFYERLYKKNPQLGDVWEDTKADGTIYRHEVIDLDSIVTVPAGTFHCVVYKGNSSTTINDKFLFWNDEVGHVMEDSGFWTMKMISHN